jgi:hypothetical protein
MQITDLATLRAARPGLEADFKALCAKYGMEFAGFSGKVGAADLELKLKAKIGGAEKVQEVAEKEYKMYARMLGLPEDGFGARFMIGGEMFKVVGVQPSKPKNCVKLLRLKDGKSFQCPGRSLVNRLG